VRWRHVRMGDEACGAVERRPLHKPPNKVSRPTGPVPAGCTKARRPLCRAPWLRRMTTTCVALRAIIRTLIATHHSVPAETSSEYAGGFVYFKVSVVVKSDRIPYIPHRLAGQFLGLFAAVGNDVAYQIRAAFVMFSALTHRQELF
jgi:hypothetical protein